MYAITGITGKVGGALARSLLADKRNVRAVLRDAAKATEWQAQGCEIAVADMDVAVIPKAGRPESQKVNLAALDEDRAAVASQLPVSRRMRRNERTSIYSEDYRWHLRGRLGEKLAISRRSATAGG